MPDIERRLWLAVQDLQGKVQQLQAENRLLAKQVQEFTELVKYHLGEPYSAEKADLASPERLREDVTDGSDSE